MTGGGTEAPGTVLEGVREFKALFGVPGQSLAFLEKGVGAGSCGGRFLSREQFRIVHREGMPECGIDNL